MSGQEPPLPELTSTKGELSLAQGHNTAEVGIKHRTSLSPQSCSLRSSLKIGGITSFQLIYEPVHEKSNNLGSDQVRHKPGCTVTEDG